MSVICAPTDYHFPALPLSQWQATKETFHLWLQIVGKIRLQLYPKLNHWWHVTLYPTVNGFSTGRIPYCGREFEIIFNCRQHQLQIQTSEGDARQFELPGLSVAAFYRRLFEGLRQLDLSVSIHKQPYLHKSTIPFDEDTVHAAYDPDAVDRFWRITSQVASVFEEFRGRFCGKSSPSQLFWHSMDLATSRFSGRLAPPRTTGTQSDKEAYTHEVISFGFWAGDDKLPEPAFYSYTYPEPPGLAEQPLQPASAFWNENQGSHMAILRYEEFRNAANPHQQLLDFMESAYQAGARLAHWPTDELRNPYVVA